MGEAKRACSYLLRERERDIYIYIYIYIYNFQLTVFKLVVWQLGTTGDVVRTRFDP